MPDDKRRERLLQLFGKESTADLSQDEASDLISRLEARKKVGAVFPGATEAK